MPRLRRSVCSGPGLTRVRRGRGFSYVEEDGTPIEDREVIERIRALAIPPAWKDVWICPQANGHIQATGIDDAGRKQYLYHQKWREHRDREKFDEMLEFAAALPELRRRVVDDLGRRGLVRDRVLACAARLLDLGFFRIGSERYADENETFGLATLRKSHLRIERGAAIFDYKAKGAKRHRRTIEDELVLPTLRALKKRNGGGAELLAYKQGAKRLGRRQVERHQRVPEAGLGRRLQRQGLPDLERDGARRGRGRGPRRRRRRPRPRASGSSTTPSSRSRAISTTRPRSAAAPTSTRASSTASSPGETIERPLRRIVGSSGPDEFPDREKIEAAVRRLIA